MKNRIVAFLLTIAICCGLFSIVAFGAEHEDRIILDVNGNFLDKDGNPFLISTNGSASLVVYKNGAWVQNKDTILLDETGTKTGVDDENGTTQYSKLIDSYVAASSKPELGLEIVFEKGGTPYYVVPQAKHTPHTFEYVYVDNDQHEKTCTYCLWADGKENHTPTPDTYENKGKVEGHEYECSGCKETITKPHTNTDDGYCDLCDYAEDFKLILDPNNGSDPVEKTIEKGCGKPLAKQDDLADTADSTFGGWYTDKAGTTPYKFGEGKLSIKDSPLTLYAKWETKTVKPETHKVTVASDIKNGTVTTDPSGEIAEGVDVTVTVAPDPGYELKTLTVDGTDVTKSVSENKYSFKMPAHEVLVSATFDKKADDKPDDKPAGSGGGSSKPSIKPGTTTTPTDPIPTPGDQTGTVAGFSDVSASAWYADAVKYVVDRGLFGGVGNGRFAPDANMTRAMMWTVLARYKGVDTNTGSNWYEAARTWAMQQNISDGTMADGNVTREQFVTMLWRLSGEPAANNSASFTDNGRVSAYAKTAVEWAVAQGIVNGYNDGSFRPQGSATRAEVAKMLMVYCVTSEG